ncbi:MAG: glycosyltransferase [Phycisphaerales bacterium]|nr:glycosyltransferase [Phycisphaerales bacterium]MCB9855579.1 glycosyltransferase [Phycisphaerales bacterium]
MHILHITQSLDPAWGGIAAVLPVLARRLVDAGLRCTLLTLSGDRFGTPAELPGLEVVAFPAIANSPLGRSSAFNHQIDEFVHDADVVHLHGLWAGQNWSAGNSARRQSKPIVITPHSHMMPWAWRRSAWKKRPVGWLFEHRNLRSAACLHALAAGEAAHMRKLGFNSNIRIIPNGLAPERFATLPTADSLEERFPELADKRWLLTLGRIAEQKGIIPGLRGMLATLPDHPEWQIVIAGPDPFELRPRLEAMAAEVRLRGRVTFTDMLHREDVRACLGRASILVQPSFSEGLSMSILEALAAGLPALVSEGCNIPEVADVDAGRIVQPEPKSIERGLRELMAMSDVERTDMGERGRQLVRERFAWDVVIPRYVEMYEAAVKCQN